MCYNTGNLEKSRLEVRGPDAQAWKMDARAGAGGAAWLLHHHAAAGAGVSGESARDEARLGHMDHNCGHPVRAALRGVERVEPDPEHPQKRAEAAGKARRPLP